METQTKYNNFKNFEELCQEISKISEINLGKKGRIFEDFAVHYFKNHKDHINKYKNIWKYQEIPKNILTAYNLPGIDTGIDILLKTITNDFIPVQCKFRSNKNTNINLSELSTFFATVTLSKLKVKQYIYFTNTTKINKFIKTTTAPIILIDGQVLNTTTMDLINTFNVNITPSKSNNLLANQIQINRPKAVQIPQLPVQTEQTNGTNVEKTFYCKICDYSACSSSNLNTHYKTQNHLKKLSDKGRIDNALYDKVFKMYKSNEECIKKYKNMGKLENNYDDYQKILEDTLDASVDFVSKTCNEEQYICTNCYQCFKSLNNYKKHSHQCPQINIKYGSLEALLIKMSVQNKQFQEICKNLSDSKQRENDTNQKELITNMQNQLKLLQETLK